MQTWPLQWSMSVDFDQLIVVLLIRSLEVLRDATMVLIALCIQRVLRGMMDRKLVRMLTSIRKGVVNVCMSMFQQCGSRVVVAIITYFFCSQGC